jgi:crotonobetainyl-CoA:carnitine CoA-transferase CaiB-like acyl-CoA transferase
VRVRVLEFGQYVAAPLTGMLLADLGAEVIKIEPPRGDPYRPLPAYETYNRGKQVLRLDLKTRGGVAEAQRLLAGADVVIDGMRRGFLTATGVLHESAAGRPDLVRCALPGFAPEIGLPEAAAWDEVIDATLGLHRPPTADGATALNTLPIASTFAGLLAANSIAAALFARLKTGKGQDIEVPVHSAMVYGMGFQLLRANWDGGPPPLLRQDTPNPMVAVYQCGDGRWLQLHCSRPRFIDAFIADQGVEDWRDEGLFAGLVERTNPGGARELQRRLQRLFAGRPARYWEERLSAAGISAAVCRRPEEWIEEPQAHESGLLRLVPSRFGLMLQPGPLVQGGADAPLRGPQRADTGVEWQAPPSPPHLPAGGAISGALQGVRVLDMSMILAGPTAGRVLAEFGADVIKVDPPLIATSEAFWLDANRGKRSIQIDLKAEAARPVFEALAARSDVLIENFRIGVADRLGAGYEAVRTLKPDVIYASMNCYGYSGPFASRPGWEHLAQAVTGMMTHFGGQAAPRINGHALADYGTGLAASLGIIDALYERELSGRGRRLTTSLTATAGMFMAPHLYSFPGHPRLELRDKSLGHSAWRRLYQAADGWLYLFCPDQAIGPLVGQAEFAHIQERARDTLPAGPESPLASEMAAVFAAKPATYWVDALAHLGVTAVPLRSAWDLFDDTGLREAGLIVTNESEDYGTIEHVGIPHRLSATPARSGRPTPAPGKDGKSILREAGIEKRSIRALFKSGVVQNSEG